MVSSDKLWIPPLQSGANLTQLIEVALPVPLPQFFSYSNDPGDDPDLVVRKDDLVVVPFGRRKGVIGLVVGVKDLAAGVTEIDGYKLKKVQRILGPEYRIEADRLALAKWLAEYYLLPLGEVVPLFHPPKPGTVARKTKSQSAGGEYPSIDKDNLVLTPHQKEAVDGAVSHLKDGTFGPMLLHGVTGSGKTEVYLNVIQAALDLGRGAIFLLPEIALTPQTLSRIHARFGDRVAAIHSALSAGQRCQVHEGAASGEIQVVVGPRSALFVPIKNLGVIVVDEEHETSYKQDEKPRYNARHAALVRGRESKSVVILGSATPDLESMVNARTNRYQLCTLPHRMGGTLPPVEIVDMRGSKAMEGFSERLVEAMDKALGADRQVILYYNRRGFARVLQCRDCGETVDCPHCDIGLTYHLRPRRMLCHYCGFHQAVIHQCPDCASEEFLPSGGGTEKVELNVLSHFPDARILRLDHDTTRKRGSHKTILAAFARGEADILIGTQMVAKGHHFPRVSLVGVLAADDGLSMPDFRSAERSFQLLTQVAGRAGRSDEGAVVFQTYKPEDPIILAASMHDYDTFLDQELPLRKMLGYPPYGRLVRIMMSGKRLGETEQASASLADALRKNLSAEKLSILGPAPGVFPRLQDKYRFQLLIKGTLGKGEKAWLADCLRSFQASYPALAVAHDMDPIAVY